MRQLLVLTAGIMLTACGSTRMEQCMIARNVIAAYDATLEAGRTPSKDEVYAATAARTLLRLSCE